MQWGNVYALRSYLTSLGGIEAVLGEKASEDFSTAGAHMHHGPVITDAEASGDRENKTSHLDDEGPGTKKFVDYETAQNRLHFGDSTA